MANRWIDLSLTVTDQVTELYLATIGRAPDKGGLSYWVNEVNSGKLTIAQVSASFFTQPEVQAEYPAGTTNSQFVTTVYNNALGRAPDAGGLGYWVGQLDAGTITRPNFILAFLQGAYDDPAAVPPSFDSSLLTNQRIAAEFFAASVDYPWAGTATDQANFLAIAAAVLVPVTGDPATGAASVDASKALTTAFVADGMTGFALTSGAGTVVEGSPLTFTLVTATASAVDQVFNLTLVGDTLGGAATAATPATDFFGVPTTVTIAAGTTTATFNITPVEDNIPEGPEGFKVSVLKGATAVASAQALITDAVGTGTTLLLTNAAVTGKADDITGTGGNDTFNALTLNFLNTGDKIDGGAGTDQLLVNVALPPAPANPLNVNANVTPVLTSVENLFVTPTAAGLGALGASIDLSSSTGYQQLWGSGFDTNSTVTFNNISTTTGVTIGMKDIAGLAVTAATAGVIAQFTNAALAGASDTVAVALNNVGQATGTGGANAPSLTIQSGAGAISGAENVAINVTGVAARLNTLDVEAAPGTADSLKMLTITGDKNLRIDAPVQFAGATGTGTVNASTFTGALNINLDNGDNVTVTGGSGNDRFAFGATLTGTDKIDGGAGTADVLASNLFTDVVAAVAAGSVSNIEGVELQLAPTTAATLNISNAGNVNLLTFAAGIGAVTSTVNNILTGATVNIGAATGGGIAQINVKDANLVANTTDVLNLNFGTSGTAAEFAVGNINTVAATGVETINIGALGLSTISGGGAAYTATIGNDASLKTINVTGNGDLTLTYVGQSLTTYDASLAAGIQTTAAGMFSTSGATIKGGSANDVLNGNTGNDTIDGGAGNDTITGGNGSDKITTGTGSDTVQLQTNGNAANATNSVVDAISDFSLGSGGDVLSLTGLANAPSLDGTISKVLVSSLTGALPVGGSSGRAELIILDSTAPGLVAADSNALNTLLFNLGGAGNYSNVLIAYSATAGGDVRLATAVIVGGDITNVTDLAVLTGVSTATLNTNFNGFNLANFNAAIVLLAPNADLSNALTVNASAPTTGAADAISTTVANLSGSKVDGGGGTDTLTITDAVGAALVLNNGAAGGTLTSIEVVNLAAGSGANAVTLAGANSITLGAASTVTLGAGAQTVTGSGGADTINTTVTNLNLANLDGGLGTDVLNITDAVGAALVLGNTTTGGTLTSIDTVNLAAGSGANNVTLHAGATLATLGAASTVTTTAANQSVTGSAGNDTVNVFAGTLTGTLTGNGGADILALTGATNLSGATITGFQTLTGGANNVTLNVAQLGAFTTAVTGTGIFTFNDATAVAIAATNAATKYQLNAAGQSFTTALAGNYSVTGGAGNDTVAMGATLTTGDTLNGAGGTDVLTFTDGDAATTDLNNVQGFETITLGNAATNVTTVAGLFTNTGGTITVDGSTLTNTLTWNGASAAGANLFSITGGTQNDVLTGGAGNDVFNATLGGNDKLTGNGGSNTFTFGSTLNTSDTVVSTGTDTLNFIDSNAAVTDLDNVSFTNNSIINILNTTSNAAVTLNGTGVISSANVTVNASSLTTGTLSWDGSLETGPTSAQIVTGGGANDTIIGGAGADTLIGGIGNDSLANRGTATNTTLADVLTGGAGIDTFLLRGAVASGTLSTLAAPNITDLNPVALGGDILQFTSAIGEYSAAGAFFAGITAAQAAGATTIQTVAVNSGAAAVVATADLVKLTTAISTTVGATTLQQAYTAAMGTASVTGVGANNRIFVSFYDTTTSKMVVGIVDVQAGGNLDSADPISLVGTLDMTQVQYDNFSSANLSIL